MRFHTADASRSRRDGASGRSLSAIEPDYGRDEAFQALYAKSAADPDSWQRFRTEYLAGDEASYQEAVRRFTEGRAPASQAAAT